MASVTATKVKLGPLGTAIDAAPTRTLAAFAADLSFSNVPGPVVEKAKALLLDYLGTAVAVVHEDPAQRLIRFARAVGGPADSRIFGAGVSVAAPWAALVNGALGHMAELDDTHRGTMSHPGDAIWAAALAVGEKTHASGAEVLNAGIAGYEVALRIGEAAMPDHWRRGWHTSGTLMSFGAAIAAGVLLKLDRTAMAWALGIAGAQASGNFAHLEDRAMTKDFNCGHAAKSGVISAMLAQEGFTGPSNVVESPRGFLALYSADRHPERLTLGLGTAWRMLEVAQKPYSSCRFIHASMDAALALQHEFGISAASITRVKARIFAAGAAIVNEPAPWEGDKGLQGTRFSAQFNLAVALLHGRKGIADLLDPQWPLRYRDAPELRAFMTKIEVIPDASLDLVFPEQPSIVDIELTDGTIHNRKVSFPLGDPESPLDHAALSEKFRRLTALAGWNDDKATSFIDLATRLDQEKSLDRLLSFL